MPVYIKKIVYALLLVIGFLAFYTILNAGNPESFLRLVFPDPRADIYIALSSSLAVFVLGFVVFYSRDREGFQHLLELNQDKIRSMRNKNMSDQDIADSLLAAMGSRTGYRHNLNRKKLILHLSEFE